MPAALKSMDNTAGLTALDGNYTYASDGSIRFYSAVGNYSYPAATSPRPHAPTSVAGQTFQYDANGNMILGLDSKRMFWDAENRLTRVVDDGIDTDYVYGADGARLKRTEDGETTLTVGPIEVRNYRGYGEMLVSYLHPSLRIEGGQTAYLHTDHLTGRIERDGPVVHIVAKRIEDISPLLSTLARPALPDMTKGQSKGAGHPVTDSPRPSAQHPREQPKRLFPSRDFH